VETADNPPLPDGSAPRSQSDRFSTACPLHSRIPGVDASCGRKSPSSTCGNGHKSSRSHPKILPSVVINNVDFILTLSILIPPSAGYYHCYSNMTDIVRSRYLNCVKLMMQLCASGCSIVPNLASPIECLFVKARLDQNGRDVSIFNSINYVITATCTHYTSIQISWSERVMSYLQHRHHYTVICATRQRNRARVVA
jgi:hypothetical protein